jgi:hypothetical protein
VKRITKKVRDEAALICQLAASNSWASNSWCVRLSDDREAIVQDVDQFAFDGQAPALRLACAAWDRVDAHLHGSACGSEPWAEAEALLRTGWTP